MKVIYITQNPVNGGYATQPAYRGLLWLNTRRISMQYFSIMGGCGIPLLNRNQKAYAFLVPYQEA